MSKSETTHKSIKSDQHQFRCSFHEELNCANILWAAVAFMWSVCELGCVPVGIRDSTEGYTVYVSVWTSTCVCESEWRQHMDGALLSCREGNNVEVYEPQLGLWPLRMTHTLVQMQIPTYTQIYIHTQLASCPLRAAVLRRGREEAGW